MKKNKISMRRCIGCMESRPKQELLRIACYEGALTVDLTGRAKGRGVYLCRGSRDCLEKARKKKALQRNFTENLDQSEVDRIFEELARDCGEKDES